MFRGLTAPSASHCGISSQPGQAPGCAKCCRQRGPGPRGLGWTRARIQDRDPRVPIIHLRPNEERPVALWSLQTGCKQPPRFQDPLSLFKGRPETASQYAEKAHHTASLKWFRVGALSNSHRCVLFRELSAGKDALGAARGVLNKSIEAQEIAGNTCKTTSGRLLQSLVLLFFRVLPVPAGCASVQKSSRG